MVKKKNGHTYIWVILVIVLLLLLLLTGLLVYFLKKKNENKEKYYFTFKKGDVWEEATFELISKGDTSTYATTFTKEEKDMYTTKLKEWVRRFPSVKNGNLVYLFSGNGPTQLYVNSQDMLGFTCLQPPSFKCYRALKLNKNKPTVRTLNNGYFHVCSDSSFSKVQSVARDSWGLSDDFTQTLISPAYKCPKGQECVADPGGLSCPDNTKCEEWSDDMSNVVFSVLAGSACMGGNFTGIWPCDDLTAGCKSFDPKADDDYKTDLSGIDKTFDKDIKSKSTAQFVVKNIAVHPDDQQYLNELVDFLKRINKTVIFFNVYFGIHDTPTGGGTRETVYMYDPSESSDVRCVTADDNPEKNNSQSFYFVLPS